VTKLGAEPQAVLTYGCAQGQLLVLETDDVEDGLAH
jgi:hypothetical protein